jgi:hypothetical protein
MLGLAPTLKYHKIKQRENVFEKRTKNKSEFHQNPHWLSVS